MCGSTHGYIFLRFSVANISLLSGETTGSKMVFAVLILIINESTPKRDNFHKMEFFRWSLHFL